MIPVDSLLYKIDQKLNKLSTNEHQQIQLEDKILALNEAQIKLIKQKVDGFSVVNGMGMDAFKKRYEDLQRLVINYNAGVLNLHLKNQTLNQWSADIDLLDPKYMFYIDSYVLADKGVCKDRQIWINKDLAKHMQLLPLHLGLFYLYLSTKTWHLLQEWHLPSENYPISLFTHHCAKRIYSWRYFHPEWLVALLIH